ncbi:hypothetical protein ARMSODRAFT_681298 [Armillaria solidipes]|uniref:Uncharacterized protein n=1 Tax=Armillaria solidipes TaxID=1076256 RepID=A0A2H3B4H0_9AGAR|nr:hypothetical protein ARMSODRAFT_681298 [Armillaria solidipes]
MRSEGKEFYSCAGVECHTLLHRRIYSLCTVCPALVSHMQSTMPLPKTHRELISHVERNESPGFCITGTFWAGRDHTKHFSSFYSVLVFLFSFRTIIARVLYSQPLER